MIFDAWNGKVKSNRSSNTNTVFLTGSSGVGKTQLAVSVFQQIADEGVDVRVWVRGESRASVVSAFAEAADYVQAPVSEMTDADGKALAFLNWLSTTDRSWLVVLDNIATPSELRDLWPVGRGRVLATTFRQDAPLHMGTSARVSLGVFNSNEARSYAERRLKVAVDNGEHTAPDVLVEVDELIRDLGALPVAMAQAISVVIFQAISCGEYREQFADRNQKLADLFPNELPADEYERTVATTWALAMEQVRALAPSGLATYLVRLVATAHPAGIPEATFLAEPSQTYLARSLTSAENPSAPSSIVNASAVRSSLRNLHSLSLIEHELDAPARVRMHALTQRAVLESASQREHYEACHALADSLNTIWNDIERHNRSILLTNVEHLVGNPIDPLWKDGIHPVVHRATQSMIEAQMLAESISISDRLIARATELLGPDHADTLTARHNLATAYGQAGRHDAAIQLLQNVLSDGGKTLGENHPEMLKTRNQIALSYKSIGRIDEAIHQYRLVLIDQRRILGEDHPHTLGIRHNLAVAYKEIGRLDEAIEMFQEVLADENRVLGSEHPNTMGTQNKLASAYKAAGRLDEAIAQHTLVLNAQKQIYEKNHPYILASRHDLASAYKAAGHLSEAIQMFAEVLIDEYKVLGKHHPSTLNTLNSLATTHDEAGHLNKAIKQYKRVLSGRQHLLGKNHPDTLNTIHNLALAYAKSGQLNEAVQMLEHVLTNLNEVLGKSHPHTLATRGNLAYVYTEVGRVNEAVQMIQQVLLDEEFFLGVNHPHSLFTRSQLATSYKRAGQLHKAIEVLEQVLPDMERVLGKDHPYTRLTQHNLAKAYCEARVQYDGA